MKKIMVNKEIKFFLIWFIIVVALEVFLFNIKYWTTIDNVEKTMDDYEVEWGEGVIYDSVTGYCKIIDPNRAYIKLNNINEHIENIHISALPVNPSISGGSGYKEFLIYVADESNSLGVYCGELMSCQDVPMSTYKVIHTSGVSEFVKIEIGKDSCIINDIGINANIPFSFSFVRAIIIYIIGLFFFLFRPKSDLYNQKLFQTFNIKNVGIILSTLLLSLVVVIFVGTAFNGEYSNVVNKNKKEARPVFEQYNELAAALMGGHVYLDREPDDEIKSLNNPYDISERITVLGEEKTEIFIDYAYYDGHFYSYFGVVPAVLFFIPYILLTGHGILTYKIVLIVTIMTIFAIYAFVYELCYKYFPNINVGTYILSTLFLTFASSWIYLVYFGVVYSLPISCALLFAFLGLMLWLRATRNNKINKLLLLLGSLCISLLLGCRPHFILVALFAIPIFWEKTLKERMFFSKKGLINTILVILPFLVMGIGIMAYNYAKFNSPFDFGAQYNLTSHDLTHNKTELEKIPLGIFTYIFMPANMTGEFPYIQICEETNSYGGYIHYETIMGGVLFYNCVLLVNFLIFRLNRQLKKNKALIFTWISLILGIIIMILDIQMAGLTQRYMSDFCWLLAISAINIIFSIDEVGNPSQRVVCLRRNLLLIGVFLTIVLNVIVVFDMHRYFPLKVYNEALFLNAKELIEFY